MADVVLNMKMDSSQAVKAIDEADKKIDALGTSASTAGKKLDRTTEDIVESWKEVSREVSKATDTIKKGLQDSNREATSFLSKGAKIGDIFSGLSGAFSIASSVGSSLAGFANDFILQPGMARETAGVQIAAAAGGGATGAAAADAAIEAATELSQKTAAPLEILLEHIRLVTAAGLDYADAISVVEDAWIAAAGQERFASNTVETFVEAMASAGESLAPFVDALKKTGIDLRPIIADITGWDLQTVLDSIDSGTVSLDVLRQALDIATQSGTAAAAAFEANSNTVASQWHAIMLELQEAFRPMAEALFPIIAQQLKGIGAFIKGLVSKTGPLPALNKALEILGTVIRGIAAIIHGVLKTWNDYGWKAFIPGAQPFMLADTVMNTIDAYKAGAEAEKKRFSEPEQKTDPLPIARLTAEMIKPAVKEVAPVVQPKVAVSPTGAVDIITPSQLPPALKAASAVTSLYGIGGGGRKVNFYEVQAVQVAQQQLTTQQRISAAVSRIADNMGPQVAVLA